VEVVFGAIDETSSLVVRVESRATSLFRCLGDVLWLVFLWSLLFKAHVVCVFVVAGFYFASWRLYGTF
jgi:hypothetical protein